MYSHKQAPSFWIYGDDGEQREYGATRRRQPETKGGKTERRARICVHSPCVLTGINDGTHRMENRIALRIARSRTLHRENCAKDLNLAVDDFNVVHASVIGSRRLRLLRRY
jgi:hypothetical protein